MAENETTETEETTDEGSVKDSGPIKQLRAAEKAARAEAAEFRTLLMEGAYNQMGLNPDEGLGKAIAKEYDGKPTAEALAAYALDEYNYTAPAGQDHPDAAQITGQQAQLDTAAAGAGSVVAPKEEDILAKAEAEGDYKTTMAIKGNQVAQMFQGR
jgi:hypothetical protein